MAGRRKSSVVIDEGEPEVVEDTKQETPIDERPLVYPDVPAEIVDEFRKILEIGPTDDPPAALLAMYVKTKRLFDICAAGEVRVRDLINMALPFIPDCEG